MARKQQERPKGTPGRSCVIEHRSCSEIDNYSGRNVDMSSVNRILLESCAVRLRCTSQRIFLATHVFASSNVRPSPPGSAGIDRRSWPDWPASLHRFTATAPQARTPCFRRPQNCCGSPGRLSRSIAPCHLWPVRLTSSVGRSTGRPRTMTTR